MGRLEFATQAFGGSRKLSRSGLAISKYCDPISEQGLLYKVLNSLSNILNLFETGRFNMSSCHQIPIVEKITLQKSSDQRFRPNVVCVLQTYFRIVSIYPT